MTDTMHRFGRNALIRLAACAALLHAVPGLAQSENYPAKPVRIIVGFQPGGPTDIFARVLAQGLGERLHQPFIVDNRPGADANIAMGMAAKAQPDGYTLYLSQSGLVINPALYRTVPFDPLKDFQPIALLGVVPNMIGVHEAVPVRDVRELIAYAKANKGRLFYGATGGAATLDTELFSSQAGIQMDRVNYKGSAPAATALMAGEVQFLLTSVGTLLPLSKSGKIRALATTGTRRSALAPDVPTVAESGLPGYSGAVWYGVVAPAGTPRPVIDLLNTEIRRQLADPAVKAQFAKQGLDDAGIETPEQFSELIRSELAKWAQVAKAANVKID